MLIRWYLWPGNHKRFIALPCMSIGKGTTMSLACSPTKKLFYDVILEFAFKYFVIKSWHRSALPQGCLVCICSVQLCFCGRGCSSDYCLVGELIFFLNGSTIMGSAVLTCTALLFELYFPSCCLEFSLLISSLHTTIKGACQWINNSIECIGVCHTIAYSSSLEAGS